MKHYDVLIIGSGLGGLTAGLKLAQAGKRVAILEQHFLAGGYATNFQRKTATGERVTFDASLHGIGGLLPGGNLHTILAELGLDEQVTFLRKQEVATLILPSGELIDIPDEFTAYKTMLQTRFPQETEAIERLFAFIATFAEDMDKVYFENQVPTYFEQLQSQSLEDFLREYTEDKALIELFSFLWLYYGLPHTELSALYYLLAWISYHIHGTFYIQGGAQALSDAYVREITSLGGEVLLRTEVVACELSEDRQTVTTKKGEVFTADDLIFNGAPQRLLATITNPTKAVTDYAAQLDQLEIGISLSQLYVGLDRLPQTLGLTKADYFTHNYDPTSNYEFVKTANYAQMDFGIVNYNLMDSTLNPQQGMICLTIGDLLSNWPTDRRSPEYKAQKAAVTEQLLARLYTLFPQTQGHVTTVELGTPLTMQRYTSNPGGAVYGFAQSTSQAGFLRPYVKTPIPHLYLASSWANPGGGYEGAIISGLTCAKKMLSSVATEATTATDAALMPVATFMQGMAASFAPVEPFTATYQFAFTDQPSFTLQTNGQQAVLLTETHAKPDVTITVSYPDWVAISEQRLDGAEAMQTGRLKITGSLPLFMKIPESFGTKQAGQASKSEAKLVKGTLFIPLALVPWMMYWITEGQLEPATYLAFAALWSGGLFAFIKPKVMRQATTLEWGTLLLFGAILLVPPRYEFLILNVAFTAMWYLTLLGGQSMTAQYAQYEYPKFMRETALFKRINHELTLIWALVFTVQTLGVFLLPPHWNLISYSVVAIGVLASIFYPKYKMGLLKKS